MLFRVKFFPALYLRANANRTKYVARPWTLLWTKPSFIIKYVKPFTLCSGAVMVFSASCQSIQPILSSKELAQIVNKADNLFNDNKFREILELLRPYKDSGIEDITWRISRAAYTWSKSKSLNKAEHAALVEESYIMAKLTLELNENSALGHKWMSIALDAYMSLQGFRSRCSTLVPVKDHMLKSLEQDPTDATVIYMVGMWYYSIADLAWYQKSILQAIAGKLPPATYEEALFYFKKAEETSPNFYSLNLLMLGKCHLKLGDRDTAIIYLQRAVNYPRFTDDDHQAHQDALQLLKALQAH